MLTVRCDSCGELVPGVWYQPVFLSKGPDGGNALAEESPKWKKKDYSICGDCCEAFVGGKMHADATTGQRNG